MSLVQDQDIEFVEAGQSDLTITIVDTASADGIKHVTDVFASKTVCMTSAYLQKAILASEDPSEIILGGKLERGASNKYGKDEGGN